jgi:hypothetical protein
MVVVDRASKDVDWLLFDLPSDLRASGPQDVATVVLLDWGKKQVDSYENGAPAYQQEVTVTVVDLATKAVIGQQHFVGGEPPQSIESSSSSGTGSKPTQEVVDYLKSLPRR